MFEGDTAYHQPNEHVANRYILKKNTDNRHETIA